MSAPSVEIQSLGQISFTCSNVERAIGFYRDVLGLPFLFSAGPGLAFFQLGAVRLMLTQPEGPGVIGNSTLYLKVADCGVAIDLVRSHTEVVSEPHLIARMPDHELWMAFFRDSEENLLAFMEERVV